MIDYKLPAIKNFCLKEIIINFFNRRIINISRTIRNRLPEKLFNWSTKIVPYIAILLIAGFTIIADIAKAAESKGVYQAVNDSSDLSPAEVAKVAAEVGRYTQNIEEDPVTIALALEDKEFLGKPVIADTQITDEPVVEQSRTKTITYIVKDNDTLSKIGWTYGLKIVTIKVTNNLSSDIISAGQKLKLPPEDISPSVLANLKKKKTTGSSGQKVPFSGTFRRPTSGWDMSQGFGRTNFERFHDGVDLTARSGTTLYASASGKVVRASRGWGGGYGNNIVIDHGDGWQTLYGHMSTFSVSAGQWVNQGQVIGQMGNSGWSTGVHVHFKITKGGRVLNPLDYL